MRSLSTLTLCIACTCMLYMVAGDVPGTDTDGTTTAPRPREMEEEELILFNVAAKGRVVELLANELARTEIIRALLVQYAKECVQNVTVLEKHCIDCMVERCENRLSECNIEAPPLAEVITHDPVPIQGLQFLEQAPRNVQKHLIDFTTRARKDILEGIPESLKKESEIIVNKEVDQSLKDLTDNIDTDKALQTLSVHIQKAADNVHKIPDLSTQVGTIIITNEDHAVNLAELLAARLKDSRPFVDSIEHNSQRIVDQMPTIVDHVVERVSVFKNKIQGMVGNVLNAFTEIMDQPDTPVANERSTQGRRQVGFQPNFNQNSQMSVNLPLNQNMQQGFQSSPQFQAQQQRFINPNAQQQFMVSQFQGQAFPSQIPASQQFQQAQPQMTNINMLQGLRGPIPRPNLPPGPPPLRRNNQFNRRMMLNQQMANAIQNNIAPTLQQPNFPTDVNNQILVPKAGPQFVPNVAQPSPVNNLPKVQVVPNTAPTRPGPVQASVMTPLGQGVNQAPMNSPNIPKIQRTQVKSVQRIKDPRPIQNQNQQQDSNQQRQMQNQQRQNQQRQNQLSQNQQRQNPQRQNLQSQNQQRQKQQIQNQQSRIQQLNDQQNQNQQQNTNQQFQQNQIMQQGQMQRNQNQQQQSQNQQRPVNTNQQRQQNQNKQQSQNQQRPQNTNQQRQQNQQNRQQTQNTQVRQRRQNAENNILVSRLKRHSDADCEKLETSPERYCKQYESHCHNCTLEKRLRFEVCGEGVEKARDEIKRLDDSVEGYLNTYESFILGQRLVLKVEMDDGKRLHKTNSYYDAYVTAKIGDSILRYKTKMILNSDDSITAGSQVGDEIWEILWEKNIFAEAKRKAIERPETGVLGQTHNRRISGLQPAAQDSGHSTGSSSVVSRVCLILGTVISLLVVVL